MSLQTTPLRTTHHHNRLKHNQIDKNMYGSGYPNSSQRIENRIEAIDRQEDSATQIAFREGFEKGREAEKSSQTDSSSWFRTYAKSDRGLIVGTLLGLIAGGFLGGAFALRNADIKPLSSRPMEVMTIQEVLEEIDANSLEIDPTNDPEITPGSNVDTTPETLSNADGNADRQILEAVRDAR
jgi:hypothetical protein